MLGGKNRFHKTLQLLSDVWFLYLRSQWGMGMMIMPLKIHGDFPHAILMLTVHMEEELSLPNIISKSIDKHHDRVEL